MNDREIQESIMNIKKWTWDEAVQCYRFKIDGVVSYRLSPKIFIDEETKRFSYMKWKLYKNDYVVHLSSTSLSGCLKACCEDYEKNFTKNINNWDNWTRDRSAEYTGMNVSVTDCRTFETDHVVFRIMKRERKINLDIAAGPIITIIYYVGIDNMEVYASPNLGDCLNFADSVAKFKRK